MKEISVSGNKTDDELGVLPVTVLDLDNPSPTIQTGTGGPKLGEHNAAVILKVLMIVKRRTARTKSPLSGWKKASKQSRVLTVIILQDREMIWHNFLLKIVTP